MNQRDGGARARATFHRAGRVELLTRGPTLDISEDHGWKADKEVAPRSLDELR